MRVMAIDGPNSNPDASDGYPDGRPQPSHNDRPGDQRATQDPPETRSRQEYREELFSACGSELGHVRPWTAVQPASERAEWRNALDERAVDRVGPGLVDERAKKFSQAERRIADYLAAGGLAVASVSEGFGIHGRTPDACADGVPVEFKSLDPGASDRTVKAALNSAKGQARNTVIDARGSGLTEDQADTGMRRFTGTPHGDRLDAVLIVGDDYIIDWKREN
jgi:Contact-dependent growth inhibition CdiA C-terminal domain